jgi:hypothetical protein
MEGFYHKKQNKTDYLAPNRTRIKSIVTQLMLMHAHMLQGVCLTSAGGIINELSCGVTEILHLGLTAGGNSIFGTH